MRSSSMQWFGQVARAKDSRPSLGRDNPSASDGVNRHGRWTMKWHVRVLVTALSLGFVMNALAASQGLVPEREPNDTVAAATPLGGADVVAIGAITPFADVDYWSFQASAGDRVYAATMTTWSGFGVSTDSVLDVIASDGVTILETDDNDGNFNAQSSSIAGCPIPTTGTYWVRVRANNLGPQISPYHLHFRLRSGAPVPESEPANDTYPGQALPAGGWVSGTISSFSNNDYYSLSLNAGDTIFASLDLDPDRDGTEVNGRLSVGRFGDAPGIMLVGDDGGNPGPDSEAAFFTVRTAGTYSVQVSTVSGGSGTYNLSVSVHPATPEGVNCTTYTSSTSVPVADLGLTSSTITVPGHPRIADLDVYIQLNHTNFADLDVHLRSPQGNDNGLFSDMGASSQRQMDTVLDDEAAIPISFIQMANMVLQPEADY